MAYKMGMDFSLRLLMSSVGILALSGGCVRVQTDPIRIEPIYIEITVNHRVQQELDNLFAELDQASETAEYVPLEPETKESGD